MNPQPIIEQNAPGGARIRLVALPTEHGGWGFLLEPIILGLALAPTASGILLGLAAPGAFLIRHPLQLALGDRKRGKRYPRTALAERFVLGYSLLAGLALLGAFVTTAFPFWQALLLAAPLAILQQVYDFRKQSRAIVPELAGAAALAALAPAITLAAGWEPWHAFALWAILIARAIPAILYVRIRLRRMRGMTVAGAPALVAHIVALAAVAGLAITRLTPWTTIVAFVLLLVRALHGLSPHRPTVRAARIGFQEMAFGMLTVVLVVAGYAF